MRTKLKFISVLMAMILLLSATGCTKNETPQESNVSTAAISAQIDSARLLSAQDVIDDLKASSGEYGLENALSELALQSETTVDGDTYYRLQQYYQGIPVYGRSIVCAVGDDGKIVAQIGNLEDIGKNLELAFSLDESEATAACEEYFSNDVAICIASPLSEDSVCIYNLYDHAPCVAYDLLVNASGDYYNMIISASGEILLCSPCLVADDGETVLGTGKDVDGNSVEFNTFRRSDTAPYVLYDYERNLIVYDAAGETVNTDYSFTNVFDGEKYHSQTKVDTLDGKSTYTLYVRERDNEVVDSSKLRFDASSLAWYFSTRESGSGLEVPTSSSAVWSDRKQVTAMNRTAAVYDFYATVLQRNGFDGNGSRMHIVINNLGAKSNTAFSLTPYHHTAMTMTSFYEEMSIDVMAHEYTHSVERSESGMKYQNESGAIMEALSDIFGELVEDYADDGNLNGSCDWDHHSRNLADPYCSGNPVEYHGTGWLPTYTDKNDLEKKGNDRGHVHNNSTVISHAAYLMWYGIDGTGSKMLSTEQLAKLWYRAMLMMPTDCSFSTCRSAVERAADLVDLTAAQLSCISEAFDAVGIYASPTDFDYVVGPGSTMCVLDKDGNPYADYACHITGTLSKRTELEDRSYSQSWLDNTADPISLPSQEGAYTVRLYDKTDAPQPISFTLKIDPYAEKQAIRIGTNYQSLASVDLDNFVVDAYAAEAPYKDAGGNQWIYEYHIPQIKLQGADIERINKEIYDKWHPAIEESIKALQKNDWAEYDGVTYEWAVNGDILSLWIYWHYMPYEYWGWDVYNISISQGRVVGKQEVLAAAGVSEGEYQEMTKEALGSDFLNYAQWYYDQVGADEFFMMQLNKTISSDNISKATPFVDQNGKLCIVADVYSLAGGDCYPAILNLTTIERSPLYDTFVDILSSGGQASGSDEYQDLPASYATFLSSRQYVDDDYYGRDMKEYCLLDIDGDGTDEVILAGTMFGIEYMIYTFEQSTNRFVLAGVGEAMSDLEYSPGNHAIVTWWRDMNNGNVLYLYTIATLNGLDLEYEPGFTYESGKDRYIDNYSGQTLSKATCEKYLADLITIDFTPLETN